MKRLLAFFALAAAGLVPSLAGAQASDANLSVLRLLSVPVTALPPIALPMPASRNHSYWIGRLQTGMRRGPGGDAIPAIGGGVDFQYRGGSIIGATVGYQKRDCGIVGTDCGGHAMFGVRSQIGLVTGGSIFAGLLNDNSATSTLGTEFGFGYSPKVSGDMNACAIDFGIPFSVAKRRQRPRLVAFVSPGAIWEYTSGSGGPTSRKSYKTDFGLALQQVGNRSIDIYLGMQKIFRAETGFQTGLSLTIVRLP
jgi:hypothetical protein